MTEENQVKAIVVKRFDGGDEDMDELTGLADAAGYEVVHHVTQTRKEDPEYNIGSGKVAELRRKCFEKDVETVIFGNRLGPYQTYNIGLKLPEGTNILDRYRLILEIFDQRAQTKKAQLQVELAELRYELPRAEAKASLAKRDEHPGFMGLGEYDESEEEDIKARISRIRDELEKIERTDEKRRRRRRESGFDLVALAGYTNAGKSTLMQALAEEIELGQNERMHDDLPTTADAHDGLFTTLDTTTRRASLLKRDVLVTDTVGFITDLPHWLVDSFESTLSSVYRADLVLLVVDATDSESVMREKIITCYDVLRGRNDTRILTVLNKTDQLTEEEVRQKRRVVSDITGDVVAISAKQAENIDELKWRIERFLPNLVRERLHVPMDDETMSLVSWIHDNAYVNDVEYANGHVTIDFEARERTVGKARSMATRRGTN